MAWTERVLEMLTSELPGVAVVVSDPDRLLRTAELQAALGESLLQVLEWDGSPAMLDQVAALSHAGHNPILVVEDSSPHLHRIASRLADHLPIELTVAVVAKRLDRTVVLAGAFVSLIEARFA